VIELPLLLVVTHFVADWLFQSDWMALNKSKHWDVLAIHVTIYSVCFVPVTAWMFFGSWRFGLLFGAITWITHFITDAITSRITSRLWFIELHERPEKDIYEAGSYKEFMLGVGKSYFGAYTHFAYVKNTRHWFFVMIGFDQLIHYTTLAYTLDYLLSR
jgi:hypothetical protein